MSQKIAIGIDFGTTYSCIGAWVNGGVVIIPNELFQKTTPSIVIFENKDKVYVGEETLSYLSEKNTVKIYEIKRLIGKTYDEIKDLKNYFSFTIEKEKNGNNPIIKIEFGNGEIEEYTPDYIASLIIKKLILNAESFLNEKINDVVITVPADFNNTQRLAIKSSAESNGVKVLQIINEPSAAALAAGYFSLNHNIKNINIQNNKKNIIKKNYILGENIHPMEDVDKNNIIDLNEEPLNLGFITKDIIKDDEDDDEENKYILVFDLGGGTYDVSLIEIDGTSLETIASSGNQELGGGNFDNKLMDFCLDSFCKNLNIDKKIIKEKYKSIQRLKIACEQAKKNLSFKEEDIIFIEDFYNEESLSISITRKKFEVLCQEYFDKLIDPINIVIKEGEKKEVNKIDEIILVGGSSKIPKIKEILSEKFKNVPINDLINPDEAVAYGATIICAKKVKSNNTLLKNFNYFDSTQHSYGIEIEDGEMQIILPKGSTYPITVSQYFHNYYDNQISFEIKVYEGEDKYCKNNHYLGKFILNNLPKMKKGELICKVNFTINMNQILKINGYVGNDIKNGIIITNDNLYENGKKITPADIKTIETNCNEKEKQLRANISEYSQNFDKMKTDDEKYTLIKNYNESIIAYLTILEEQYCDIESEKFLILIEKLFKSYTYIFTTNLYKKLSADDRNIIEKNINQFLSIIGLRNPFRLKQMLIFFKPIKKEISEILYTSSSYCIEILYQNGDKFLNLNNKNSSLIAQKFYEEVLSIEKSIFMDDKDDKIKNLLPNELKIKFNKIKEECEEKIKIIYVHYFSIIEQTKKTGKLADLKLDKENLSLLSFNLYECLRKIKSIKDLYNNKDLLELKSICLANIVKIEFSLKKTKCDIEALNDYAKESIDIVDNKLGPSYNKKDWYSEIIELKNNIEKEIQNSKNNYKNEIEEMRQKFEEKLNFGAEEFLKFLLEKYPYEGYSKDDNIIEEYKSNKKKAIKKLKIKYNNYDIPSTPLNNRVTNDLLTQKKEIILEYINSMRNF